MTTRERTIRNMAWSIVRAAREVQGAVELYDDQANGKGSEYSSIEEAESDLRAAVSDLRFFVNEFRGIA